MVYYYEQKLKKYSKEIFLLLISFTILALLSSTSDQKDEIKLTESDTSILEFNEDNLISKIKSLNFKYPHIVLAQAKLESGNFNSKLFKENNNLFGMRNPKVRITTSAGSQNGYAYYSSWIESVYDYAFYSSSYLNKAKNEREYYMYLSTNYAEDTLYVNRLKNIVEKDKLKNIFEN